MVRPAAPYGIGAVAPPTGNHVLPLFCGVSVVLYPVVCDTKVSASDPADSNDRSESLDEVSGSYLPCDLLCLANLAARLSGVMFLEDLALAGGSTSGLLEELRASRWCLRRSARAISGVVGAR